MVPTARHVRAAFPHVLPHHIHSAAMSKCESISSGTYLPGSRVLLSTIVIPSRLESSLVTLFALSTGVMYLVCHRLLYLFPVVTFYSESRVVLREVTPSLNRAGLQHKVPQRTPLTAQNKCCHCSCSCAFALASRLEVPPCLRQPLIHRTLHVAFSRLSGPEVWRGDSPFGQPADAGALPVGHGRQVGAVSQSFPALHVHKCPRDRLRKLGNKVPKLTPPCHAIEVVRHWLG